mgnify:CR=1 FL=1
MIEHKLLLDHERFKSKGVTIHNTEIPEDEAKLALDLITRWGMVAGVPDGEDSSGRSKLRLSTPEELSERAFNTAKVAFDTIRANGLMYQIGSFLDNDED